VNATKGLLNVDQVTSMKAHAVYAVLASACATASADGAIGDRVAPKVCVSRAKKTMRRAKMGVVSADRAATISACGTNGRPAKAAAI